MDNDIIERSQKYADEYEREIYSWDDLCRYRVAQQARLAAYTRGAEDQKVIDDSKWLKIKASWEKQAQINHDDEANYKQGYHDAIQKAYKWIKANTEGGVHPQNAYGFADRFLKMMEK